MFDEHDGATVTKGRVMMRTRLMSVAVLVVLALAVAELAGPPFRAKPFEFDPGNTGIVEAALDYLTRPA